MEAGHTSKEARNHVGHSKNTPDDNVASFYVRVALPSRRGASHTVAHNEPTTDQKGLRTFVFR